MGQLRESAGDSTQALANYSRALAINPQQPALATRGAAIQRGQTGLSRTAALPPTQAPPSPDASPSASEDASWGPGR
jgi:hypothetical protein